MSESVNRIRQQIKDKQLQKIISMQPGRLLDALVAEYVMGYHVEERYVTTDDLPDYWYRSHSAVKLLGDQEWERVPNYSTVLYSAMQIIPKYKHWAIQGNSAEGKVSASLSNGTETGVWIRSCPTIPEAVCKAALVSLVEENRMLDKLLQE